MRHCSMDSAREHISTTDSCLYFINRTACRLPVKYKMRLQHFFVLHSDMTLWVSTSAVCPFLSHGFWGKMRFMQRVEMLWDHIDKVRR